MRQVRAAGAVVVAILGLALAGTASAAPAAGVWTKIGADTNTVTVVPSVALDGPKVVAAWVVPGVGGARAQSATLTPTVAAAGRAPQIVDIVSGWSSTYTAALLGAPGGGLQVMLDGYHTLVTGDPLNGISFAPRNADGTFGAPAGAGVGNGGSTAILAADGLTPLFATTSSGVFRLYRGASAPAAIDLAATLGPTAEYQIPRLGRDGTGRYWIAWYGAGLHLAQIDSATGAVIGAPGLAPQSGGIGNVSQAIALACGPANCRIVYHQNLASGDTGRILSWAPGDAAPANVGSGGDPSSDMAAAYRADGRLWVVWYSRAGTPAYKAVLGDSRGAGGAVRTLGTPPHGRDYSAGSLAAIDAGGRLALVAAFENGGTYNQWFTVAEPPAAAGGVDTSGIDDPRIIRRGSSTFVVPRHPTRAALRRTKCVNVRVATTRPAAIRVAIFSGRKSIRVFGATIVRFTKPGSRIVCIRVPLRAKTFDVRKPFRFAFAARVGAHPARSAPTTLTTSGFVNFE